MKKYTLLILMLAFCASCTNLNGLSKEEGLKGGYLFYNQQKHRIEQMPYFTMDGCTFAYYPAGMFEYYQTSIDNGTRNSNTVEGSLLRQGDNYILNAYPKDGSFSIEPRGALASADSIQLQFCNERQPLRYNNDSIIICTNSCHFRHAVLDNTGSITLSNDELQDIKDITFHGGNCFPVNKYLRNMHQGHRNAILFSNESFAGVFSNNVLIPDGDTLTLPVTQNGGLLFANKYLKADNVR